MLADTFAFRTGGTIADAVRDAEQGKNGDPRRRIFERADKHHIVEFGNLRFGNTLKFNCLTFGWGDMFVGANLIWGDKHVGANFGGRVGFAPSSCTTLLLPSAFTHSAFGAASVSSSPIA